MKTNLASNLKIEQKFEENQTLTYVVLNKPRDSNSMFQSMTKE